MKEIFINKDNLSSANIDEEVIRVKGLIINDKDDVLLGYANNIYQFPGGHLEKGETINETLKREIAEETGICIDSSNLKPFMLLKYYSKNYLNTGKNRCNKIYYIEVKTNSNPDLSKTNYTDYEIENNYELRRVNLNALKETLKANSNLYPDSKIITDEMLMVIDEYLKNAQLNKR